MRRNSIFAFIVFGILLLSTSGAVAQDYKKAIEKMAESIASSIRQEARRKVTTLDFTTQQGEVNEFGRYISELVSMEVSKQGRMYNFPVIDRANLRNILKEYKLSATGMIASNDTKKLGQLSGVDIIIVGSITPLSTKYDVIVKAISTDTAVNIGTWNVEIERSPEFAGLWEGNLGTHYPDDPERGHRQTSMDLEIELTSIDVVEDELIANLTFRNRSGTKQGIALKAQHSDGIADFWKFMPHSEGYMSDSNGNRYPFTSASGILWARTSDEFKMIKPSKSVSLSLRFRRGNREVSPPLAMNIDFWVGKAGSKVAVMNLSFRDISIKRKR